MARKLKVKVSEKVLIWFIFVDDRPITGFNRDNEVLLTLADGTHRLSYQLTGEGGTIEFELEGSPPIRIPPGATWPVSDAVPDGETGTANAFYFRIGQ